MVLPTVTVVLSGVAAGLTVMLPIPGDLPASFIAGNLVPDCSYLASDFTAMGAFTPSTVPNRLLQIVKAVEDRYGKRTVVLNGTSADAWFEQITSPAGDGLGGIQRQFE